VKEAVIVPCYNEEKRLELERFSVFQAKGVDVVFVDDGSRDATRSRIERFIAEKPGHHLFALERNSGKAEAVRQGLLRAIAQGATTVGYLDADLATPPGQMLELLEVVRGGAKVALGSRVSLLGRSIDRHPTRHYLGRIFATAASMALGIRVYDTQCGAKVFAVTPALREALARPFKSRWVFDVELLDRLLNDPSERPLRVEELVEVPLQEWRDVKGSKLTATAMTRAALDLTAIAMRRRRP
jgi:glycosyltransferase involved in cell wall biosynthesis